MQMKRKISISKKNMGKISFDTDLVMNLIKGGIVLMLLVYLVVIYRGDNAKDLPMNEIVQEMEKDADIIALQKKGTLDLKRFMGLDETVFDGTFYYKAESPMAVEEILIVKVKSRDQLESLEKSMEEHIKKQKKSFEGYGAEQTALLNQAIIEKRGLYGFMAVGEKAPQWKQRFQDFVS